MRTSVKTQNVSAKSQAAPKAREAVKPQLSVEEEACYGRRFSHHLMN